MESQDKDDLFELIKSLTKTEKTYFKKVASQHIKGETNNYLLLFDILDKQKKPDDKETHAAFDKVPFEQLPRLKNYLYENLLKALNAYHAEHSLNAELIELLRRVEVLWQKGLYEQCAKFVKKIIKIASEHELFLIKMEALKWEQRLIFDRMSKADSLKKLEENKNNQLDTWDVYRKKIDYEYFGNAINIKMYKNGPSRTKEHAKTFTDIAGASLLKKGAVEINCGTIEIAYYTIKRSYSMAVVDKKNELIYSDKIFDVYKKNPKLIIPDVRKYVSFLFAHATSRLNKVYYERAKEPIDLFIQIPDLYAKYCSEELVYQIQVEHCCLYLEYCIFSGKFDDGLKKAAEAEELIERPNSEFFNKYRMAFLSFLISNIYFINADYKKASYWNNRILNNSSIQYLHLYPHALLYNLFIQYELNNFELIEYNLKSTYSTLVRHNVLFDFEKAMLVNVRKYLLNENKEDIKEKKQLAVVYKKLCEMKQSDYLKNAVFFFDFVTWMQSKVEDKSYYDVLKKNIANNTPN
jgi:hypothetical protein